MRTPFEEARVRDLAPLRAQFAEGFRYMWDHAFLRTTAFVYGAGNFLTAALFLLIVVIGDGGRLTPGRSGCSAQPSAAGTLVGSLASPLFRRLLAVRTILLLELWTWLATWAFVVVAARLGARRLGAALRDRRAGHRLGRRRLSDRHDAGPAGRRVESVRTTMSLAVRAARAAARGLADRDDERARDRRGVRHGRPRARAVGDVELRDSERTQPERAGDGRGVVRKFAGRGVKSDSSPDPWGVHWRLKTSNAEL
jgi:hypothetical protein